MDERDQRDGSAPTRRARSAPGTPQAPASRVRHPTRV